MPRLARWVSIAAHPFVVAPALLAAVEAPRGPLAAARTVGAAALLFVLPLAALMAGQVRRGAWRDVDASRPTDRPALFVVGAAGLLALLGWFAAAREGPPLLRAGIGVLAMLAVAAAMTRWIKVSLHVATAALAAAALLARGMPVGWIFAAIVPALAWSRVALGRHRRIEVALGALVGTVAGALIGRLA